MGGKVSNDMGSERLN